MSTGRRSRAVVFAALCTACVLVAGVTVVRAASRNTTATKGTGLPTATSVEPGQLLFRNTRVGSGGELAVAPLAGDHQPRAVAPLKCARVDFAGGRGVCAAFGNGVVPGYTAVVFDARFRRLGSVDLAGTPSRVRVSQDGALGAVTTFVHGDSYRNIGFSTRTTLIDLSTRAVVDELEHFTVLRDGKPFSAVDFNFWGVTFTSDHNRFFATLGTGGHTYLVHGDVAARRLETVTENVECPSLSPDGRRLAFKKEVSQGLGPVRWQLWVLDLDTMRQWPLAETRNVDDQPAWLDGSNVLYGLAANGDAIASAAGGPVRPTDVWVVAADGTGTPAIYLPGASSPSAVPD